MVKYRNNVASLQKFLHIRVARYFLVKRSVYILSSRKQCFFRRNLHFFFACKCRMKSIKLPVVSILSLSIRKYRSTITKTDTDRLASLQLWNLMAVSRFEIKIVEQRRNWNWQLNLSFVKHLKLQWHEYLVTSERPILLNNQF